MKTTMVYDSYMRGMSFLTFDALLKAIRDHALTSNYVADLLMDRGIITPKADGTWVGVPLQASEPSKKTRRGETPVDWNPQWPSKEALLEIIGSKGSIKFLMILKHLADMSETATHWYTVHALRHLVRDGKIEKLPNGFYALTKAEQAGVQTYSFDSLKFALPLPGKPATDINDIVKKLQEKGITIDRYELYPILKGFINEGKVTSEIDQSIIAPVYKQAAIKEIE
jgi:hypothetical protein